MSYFQKYHKAVLNPSHSHNYSENFPNSQFSPSELRKNSDSRQSYLKAFKKYYIDKLIHQKTQPPQQGVQLENKENFYHQQSHQFSHQKSSISAQKSSKSTSFSKQSVMRQKKGQVGDPVKMNRNKIVALVNNNQNQLQQLLYSSIGQVQREMMLAGSSNDLLRQNRALKDSIYRLKTLLKQKLQIALKKNKQELTLMFDQYSTMIKKLLEDKQQLTNQLQGFRQQLQRQQYQIQKMQAEYENKIRIIMEDNSLQITTTKQQIQEFLDIIVQYQEEAHNQKQEFERIREKVVELQMENDQLRTQNRESSPFNQSQSNPLIEKDIQRYANKIQNLLNVVQKLQEENSQLSQFLKSCKCSKIKKTTNSNSSLQASSVEEMTEMYEKRMLEGQRQNLREEMMLRQAMRRKDQCIERLNLVIEQMRRGRFQSVDRITHQAITLQSK